MKSVHRIAFGLLIAAGCSHAGELDDVAQSRLRGTDMGSSMEPPPAPPPEVKPCLAAPPTSEAQIGRTRDVQPETPSVELALAVQLSATCSATTLRAGLCTRDASGAPVAPASWQGELPVEPGLRYSPVVTLPDRAGSYTPCVQLDQLYAVSTERVCDGGEVLCSADSTCHSGTDSDPRHCGVSCRECPDGDQGDPICVQGACKLKCNDGYRYEAGACRPRPGCKGLETACRGDDCCAIDEITEGPGQPLRVKRGYDASNSADGLPEFQSVSTPPVNVTPFWLDRYEVTVSRFRKFVDAYEGWRKAANPRPGHGEQPNVPGSGWEDNWTRQGVITDFAEPIYILPPTRTELVASLRASACGQYTTWTDAAGANESLPINCVNFWLAYLYCIWDGESVNSRLPTEAEWNAAAAGGEQQRAYPWSSPDPASRDTEGRAGFGAGDRLPYEVGSFKAGAGRWGTQDLAGNVWEWVRDSSPEDVQDFRYVPVASDPVDLANDVNAMQAHALRGGSFKDFSCPTCDAAARCRTPAREVLRPYRVFNDVGFRCARNFR